VPAVAEPVIAVHGGAGLAPEDDRRVEGIHVALRAAVEAGSGVLARGGSALDAVEAAVIVLEDAPELNAGRGSVLTPDGRVEMDAAVMDGAGRAAGAVALVRGVRNPVQAARALLDDGSYVMLAGDGAAAFARERGLAFEAEDWFVTDRQRERLRRARADLRGTVGAVARDAGGHLAAATSTGGRAGKRSGRIGDSPMLGAGTWADDRTAAVSGTGDGEAFMRSLPCHELDALLRHRGLGLAEAAERALSDLDGGLIAVDRDGNLALPFNTEVMARGWRTGDGPVQTALEAAIGARDA
jgi:beta-aspartyl-peptidase (threonine type)